MRSLAKRERTKDVEMKKKITRSRSCVDCKEREREKWKRERGVQAELTAKWISARGTPKKKYINQDLIRDCSCTPRGSTQRGWVTKNEIFQISALCVHYSSLKRSNDMTADHFNTNPCLCISFLWKLNIPCLIKMDHILLDIWVPAISDKLLKHIAVWKWMRINILSTFNRFTFSRSPALH